ncbi:Cyclic nucleotide-binding domain-containing protein [Cynara cardunculus var. scolymus]|uniref:Cyclic nucleotide-binding domain-containing protein n=1 Tax=Cynara cardunculus var. scolymus TaxID=59895 RepID=A0A103XWI2_CYNCS|nr:Cyclic nucleotide-binding domain-containing protein [Cynara cardunculus var. scolymus]
MNTMNYVRLSSTTIIPQPTKPTLLVPNNPKGSWWTQIFDPGGQFIARWNYMFLITCLNALFVDPLYFLVPEISRRKSCMRSDYGFAAVITVWRSMIDIIAFIHIFIKFRTAYVAPNSRVFGRGDLVMDARKIAFRYLRTGFAVDLAAALPLPQIFIWFVIPAVKNPSTAHANHSLSLIIIIQYIPRLFIIFPLNQRITKTTGVIAQTAWAGAAYYLMLYMLASHEKNLSHPCNRLYFDCDHVDEPGRDAWLKETQVLNHCSAEISPVNFTFGMYAPAFTEGVTSATFFEKYFFCFWFGLKSLSSYGQNLETSNTRLEEWRVKRRDTEEWMRHRQLPPDLQDKIRRFVQYKWLATRGVDEEDILRALPLDLRRQIQRHLCLALVRRVPFFSQMDDDQLLDVICEHLVPSLSTKGQYLVREGDPVNEMTFVIRGQLESSTTNGGRSGFFNSITLKPGDFCGEELLTWALTPESNVSLPSSTRTVKVLNEVEAFALRAEDLRFVAKQFKRLHSKKLQHAFRYYSHQWRTWGACFIQAAWRRHKRKKLAEELARQEGLYQYYDNDDGSGENDQNVQHLGATILASRFAANTKRGISQKERVASPASSSLKMPKLFKPDEPDFS